MKLKEVCRAVKGLEIEVRSFMGHWQNIHVQAKPYINMEGWDLTNWLTVGEAKRLIKEIQYHINRIEKAKE